MSFPIFCDLLRLRPSSREARRCSAAVLPRQALLEGEDVPASQWDGQGSPGALLGLKEGDRSRRPVYRIFIVN